MSVQVGIVIEYVSGYRALDLDSLNYDGVADNGAAVQDESWLFGEGIA